MKIDTFDGLIRTFYDPPINSDQLVRQHQIRGGMFTAAHLVLETCPESPERTLALRHLQQAMMFAVTAIGLQLPQPVTPPPTDEAPTPLL